MRAWLVALTDLGDLAVLLPLAAAMLAWLLLSLLAQRRDEPSLLDPA